MNIGRQNQVADFTISDHDRESRKPTIITIERDLSVQICKDLKPHDQVCKAASTANRFVGMWKNTFLSRDPELWKELYTAYVRPHS